jgi:hypothetical protein
MTNAAGKNMAFGAVNAFVILVHNKHPPTDDEWKDYLQFSVARGLSYGVTSRYLVLSEGGAPSTSQRRTLADAIAPILQKNPSAMRTAIVTSSTFVRGVVTAMRLFEPIYQAFSPDDMKGAYAYLGITPAYFREIEAMIAALKAQLRQ